MMFVIRGGTLIPCITTGIARWNLQQFYDYPGSDEPSDNFVPISVSGRLRTWVYMVPMCKPSRLLCLYLLHIDTSASR